MVDVVFRSKGEKRLYIAFRNGLCRAASGIAGEKGKRGCPQLDSMFSHCQIALGRGQVVSDS